MGLLTEGEPLEWEEMKDWQSHVRKYGVEQFIRLYNRLKVKFPHDDRMVNRTVMVMMVTSCVSERLWAGVEMG